MSTVSAASPSVRRTTVPQLRALKGVRPLVALTAYTAPVARAVEAHVDLLLVGDSLGMVLYGMDSTLGVTLADMKRHSEAVVRVTSQACVAADLPFGSYQRSKEQAFDNAAALMQASGVQAVKLEGGEAMAETVAFLSERAIPVIGHIGLKPQHMHQMGGYVRQGRDAASRDTLFTEATALAQAGAFALVLEGMNPEAAAAITRAVAIPTIGIGAGPDCDGAIVVTEDMAGFHEATPPFVRRFAETGRALETAASAYAEAVLTRQFP